MDDQFAANFRDAESLGFFYTLSTRDATARAQALDVIAKTLESWRDGYGSPPDHDSNIVINDHHTSLHNNDIHSNDDGIYGNPNGHHGNYQHCHAHGGVIVDFRLEEQVPDLVRLKHTCPYQDVRDRCQSIIDELKVSPHHIVLISSVVQGCANFFALPAICSR